MTVDELVVKIFFEVDNKSFQQLSKLEELLTGIKKPAKEVADSAEDMGDKVKKGSDKAARGAEKMDKSLKKASKSGGVMTKSTDMLAGSFRKVAVAAASALSVTAAMRFALNVADDTKKMDDMATSLGGNTRELMLLGSAMRSAGRDADAFFSDWKGIQKEYGEYSFDDVLRDADELSDIMNREGVPAALQHAQAVGWGDDAALWLMQGSEAILEEMERSRKLGHEVSEQQIENNKRVAKSWNTLKETIDATGRKIISEAGPGLVQALDMITNSIGNNQDAINEWSTAAGGAIERFVAGATGQLDLADSRLSRFNKRLSADNARSADPEVRKQEIGERAVDSAWSMAGGLLDTGNSLALKFMFPGLSVFEGKPLHESTRDKVGEGYDRAAKALEPTIEAYNIDAAIRRGDSFRPDMPVTPTYRPGGFRRTPADPLKSPFPNLERLEGTYQNHPGYEDSRLEVDGVPLDEEAKASLAKWPSGRGGPGKHPGYSLSDLEELTGYFLPPTAMRSLDQSTEHDDSGITIQHQEINIDARNTGADPQRLGALLAPEIRNSSRRADFAPRRR